MEEEKEEEWSVDADNEEGGDSWGVGGGEVGFFE